MRIVAACFVMTLALPAPGAPAAVDTDTVVVRVYDSADLRPGILEGALATARASLASAFLDVRWKACNTPQESTACSAPPAGELIVRIVRAAKRTPRGSRGSTGLVPLGDALIDPETGAGTLATAYFDSIAGLAARSGTNVSTLLGYAIAHELGHLLLESHAHSAEGLMRPEWHSSELRRARAADWQFTPRQVAAIRGRLVLAVRGTAGDSRVPTGVPGDRRIE